MGGSRLFQVGNFSSVEFIYVQQITHQNHYVSMSIQNLFFIFFQPKNIDSFHIPPQKCLLLDCVLANFVSWANFKLTLFFVKCRLVH